MADICVHVCSAAFYTTRCKHLRLHLIHQCLATILHESGALSCALEKTFMRRKDKNLVENMWYKYAASLV